MPERDLIESSFAPTLPAKRKIEARRKTANADTIPPLIRGRSFRLDNNPITGCTCSHNPFWKEKHATTAFPL
jgi:hypothetical protein